MSKWKGRILVVNGFEAYCLFGFLLAFRNCFLFLRPLLSSLKSALHVHFAEMCRLVRRTPQERFQVELDVFELDVACLKHALFASVSP